MKRLALDISSAVSLKTVNIFARRALGSVIFAAAVSLAAVANAQHSGRYEIERDMPLFLDSLKQELTYPLAWDNTTSLTLALGATWLAKR